MICDDFSGPKYLESNEFSLKDAAKNSSVAKVLHTLSCEKGKMFRMFFLIGKTAFAPIITSFPCLQTSSPPIEITLFKRGFFLITGSKLAYLVLIS